MVAVTGVVPGVAAKKWKRWRLRVQLGWDPRPGQATCGDSDNDKDFYDSLKPIEACTGLLLIVSDRSCRRHGRCHLGLSRAHRRTCAAHALRLSCSVGQYHNQDKHEAVYDLYGSQVRHTNRQSARLRQKCSVEAVRTKRDGHCKDVDLALEDKGEGGEDATKNVGRHDEERNAEVAQYLRIL